MNQANPVVRRKLRVGPVDGRTVRDPATYKIITEETRVPDTSYWRRRIAKGDLVNLDAAVAEKPAPKGKPKKGAEA